MVIQTPNFSRIEIRVHDQTERARAVIELRKLADELEAINSTTWPDEESALLYANHKIKATSTKLRTP